MTIPATSAFVIAGIGIPASELPATMSDRAIPALGSSEEPLSPSTAQRNLFRHAYFAAGQRLSHCFLKGRPSHVPPGNPTHLLELRYPKAIFGRMLRDARITPYTHHPGTLDHP